ncbi:hypothetical protein SAMN05444161_4212 [Rhizobiales bacterium GAS191]|nr:hypothetical protein SAMN05444161_4212 [Rhizobiales bacterium GAS191]
MTVNIEAWRKVFKQVVSGLANEGSQRRGWFGIGPEQSSPGEEFNMFFNDVAAKALLARKDNGFTEPQQCAAQELYNLMRKLSDETPDNIFPEDLIDDPRWIEVRLAAARPLALL